MYRKRKSTVKGDSKKSWSRIEEERELEQVEAGLKISVVGIDRKEAGFPFARTERKAPVRRPAFTSNQGSFCGLSQVSAAEGPDGKVVNVKGAADARRWICWEIVNETRERNRAKNKSLQNISGDSKEAKEGERSNVLNPVWSLLTEAAQFTS